MDSTIEKYNFMANLMFSEDFSIYDHQCGGALLNPRTVLSAAQCLIGLPAARWRVRLGSAAVNSGGSLHQVSRIILHPQFSIFTADHDIAVVRLADQAVYSPSVGAAFIAASSLEIEDGTKVTALGWGDLSNDEDKPTTLQEVELNVVNQESCYQLYELLKSQPDFLTWPSVTPQMMCIGVADVGGKGNCAGDTGSPVMYGENVVVGVASWAYQCGDSEYPSVVTRVSNYTDWVVENAV
ncbi:hypothetical protein JYU34_008674 [Plutella xylostella]|uniref:Peptidase S1 domain-containing protein n=1 Tax=Plutella xylostella TaxID=51655 RepID=A0ABQ7QMN2_PLUXY|nr:hypothetical protein JYU34_008674 [Plutella xylostella]